MKRVYYTLVQHSGFGYSNKEEFENGVEHRAVDSITDLKTVGRAGGFLFNSYAEANTAEDRENYPEGCEHLAPRVSGKFSERVVDGLRVYIV